MRRIGLFLLVFSTAAAAQTTRPAESAWPRLVVDLAAAVVDSSAAASEVLADSRPIIRRFGSGESADMQDLLRVTARATVLGAHGYSYAPLAMAADLAADFKTSNVPDDVKKKMIPADDAEMKRANAIAAQWMGDVLRAQTGQPVGVIALWVTPATVPGLQSATGRSEVIFMLVAGEETAPGKFRVRQLHYGSAESASR